MLVVFVHVQVKEKDLDAFKAATLENARNSVREPGIARFDFFQQQDDPSKFGLVEVYRDLEATAEQKATAHYAKWRVKYDNVFPDDDNY